MGATAAVLGASGYAGGELLRLLAGHPEISVGSCVANRHAGVRIGDIHPGLTSLADRSLVSLVDADLASADVVFVALPHGESAAVTDSLPEHVVVVDLGADHRLTDPAAWNRWYAGEYAGAWLYGLPELPGRRAEVAAVRRVANPGCYATAIALAFAPLLSAGVIEPDLVVVAASGTTGAGRTATERLLASEVIGDLAAYKVGGAHQHTPEIVQALAPLSPAPPSLSFTPVLAPMPRGILAVCSAPLRSPASTDELRSVMHDAYAMEAFVHLLSQGRTAHTAATLGSNSVQLQVDTDADARRVVVIAALDNLGKGAAGQAIQNANLMLGLPETAGLPVDGGLR